MAILPKFFATLCYSGLVKVAPGTVGTLVACLISLPFAFAGFSFALQAFLYSSLVATGLGFVYIPKYLSGKTDDMQEIVIDEASGVYFTIYLSLLACKFLSIHKNKNWYILTIIALSFIFFRIFDITKPLFIGYADRKLKGTFGIMMDDILASVPSCICVCGLMFVIFKYKLLP